MSVQTPPAPRPGDPAGFPDSELWDFSLAVYGRPDVAASCLTLQDRHGLDVNLLLFCLWTAASGRGPLDDDAIAASRSASGAWRDTVVAPLRALRRHLGPAAAGPDGTIVGPCREAVKAAELAAEHAQQLLLARGAPDPAGRGRAGDAGRSLHVYLRAEGIAAGAIDPALWRPLLNATFPDAADAAIADALRHLTGDDG